MSSDDEPRVCMRGHLIEGDNESVQRHGKRTRHICLQCLRDRQELFRQRRAEHLDELAEPGPCSKGHARVRYPSGNIKCPTCAHDYAMQRRHQETNDS